MIELSRHIESLLLVHNCVIVPGLGGFVAHYVPARRIDEEQLFLPPYRSVGFNQQLCINDGLLVQSYMQAYDTSYPETIRLIDDAVARLKEQIEEEGSYELSGIGTLTSSMGGNYSFVPCEAGVLSPDLYGLDSIVIRTISTHSAPTEATGEGQSAHSKKIHLKRTEREYTFSISREIVNYVAAAVVAVCFYFLWATPISHVEGQGTQQAASVCEQLFAEHDATVPSRPTIPAVTPVTANKHTEMEVSTTNTKLVGVTSTVKEAAPSQPKVAEDRTAGVPQQTLGTYTIVLASAISQGNAEKFSEMLKKEGLDATPYRRGRMVRVVSGSYPTEAEARAALVKLRKHEAFAEAWVMKR
ncbi:MAG: SPOR domain-containing protein [Bacteroidales bacterium]|nr:SPOR domain-containing protein [Bacteroidales bacterium]